MGNALNSPQAKHWGSCQQDHQGPAGPSPGAAPGALPGLHQHQSLHQPLLQPNLLSRIPVPVCRFRNPLHPGRSFVELKVRTIEAMAKPEQGSSSSQEAFKTQGLKQTFKHITVNADLVEDVHAHCRGLEQ